MKLLPRLALGLLLLGASRLCAQVNLVTDGEFNGSSFGPAWATQADTSGGSDFFVDAGAAYFGSSGNFDYIAQSLPTTIGVTYQISFDLATSGSEGASIALATPAVGDSDFDDEFVANYGGVLQASQIGTTTLGSPNFIAGGNTFDDITYASVSPSYIDYTTNFTANSTATNLIFGGYNVPQYFFLDHVSVEAIPEPAQWGLPMLAGFVALLFWRKFRPQLKFNHG